ncbi:MAG: DinB family protein [Cytophagales bacterium]|uniref:hypothetical protein n=1 Tax=Cyclobacterium marinum TaxID=104 RepID=UPI0030DB3C09|nr:DinB family protein [Cytophagales bacterium]
MEKLTIKQYNYKSKFLSGATIGQHIRHILEFYICIREAMDSKLTAINYDKRKRDNSIEQDPKTALAAVGHVVRFLEGEKFSGEASLVTNFSLLENCECVIPSSFLRELVYCLEHSIHHQALIKISLLDQGLVHLVDSDFGVAPSTTKSRLAKADK